MKYFFTSLFCQLLLCAAISQVSTGLTVPDSIVKNASVIMLQNENFFEITDIDHATLKVNRVYKVRNSYGKDALVFNVYNNKMVNLANADITVYNSTGAQVGKYTQKDMRTTATGEGLVDDGTITYFSIPAVGYPVTIALKYEVKYKGTLFLPAFNIQGSGEAVLSASYTAKVPAEIDLRYKASNTNLQPDLHTEGKFKLYKWTAENLAPIEYEEGAANFESRYPRIILAPKSFKVYNTQGNMETWKQFGIWAYELQEGLNKLPKERIDFFKDLVKNETTDINRIKILYHYLQQNFRYVSIQLGIGGYKPFSASFTDTKKYGDCKGLSFYLHSILTALDIKSHVALINADYNAVPVDREFPCNQFNHMILCVPGSTDTTWLECTSKTNDFGVLGSATENRNALLITAEGGKLVQTPTGKSASNRFTSRTVVNLAEDGTGKIDLQMNVSGVFKAALQKALEEESEDQASYLVNQIGLKLPSEFKLTQNTVSSPYFSSIAMQLEKVAEFTAGSKSFFTKHLFKFISSPLPENSKRRLDYYFYYPFEKTDTTVYQLPKDQEPDVLPVSKEIANELVQYNTKSWYDASEHAIYSVANFRLAQNKIPAAKYATMKTVFDEIIKDELKQLVTRKK